MNRDFWLLGIHRRILAEGTETNGQFDMIEGYFPAGIQTPPHIHQQYVETHYVAEGELTILTNNSKITLQTGESYSIPKGLPHCLWTSKEKPARIITVFSPAGFATVVKQAGFAGNVSEGKQHTPTDMALVDKLSTAIGDITLGPVGAQP